VEYCAWPGNSGSGAMNELGHCHDEATSCVHSCAPVSCTELHRDDRGLLCSTPY
jgi:hypothetical protein